MGKGEVGFKAPSLNKGSSCPHNVGIRKQVVETSSAGKNVIIGKLLLVPYGSSFAAFSIRAAGEVMNSKHESTPFVFGFETWGSTRATVSLWARRAAEGGEPFALRGGHQC